MFLRFTLLLIVLINHVVVDLTEVRNRMPLDLLSTKKGNSPFIESTPKHPGCYLVVTCQPHLCGRFPKDYWVSTPGLGCKTRACVGETRDAPSLKQGYPPIFLLEHTRTQFDESVRNPPDSPVSSSTSPFMRLDNRPVSSRWVLHCSLT